MSIHGIGVDQVDLKRIRKLLKKSEAKFLKRCFTEQEIKYARRFSDSSKRLGARFAAKEAVMKSLGKGWREISWRDIEITGGGKPTINTFGRALVVVEENNISNIHISLSHENDMAIAFAISEKNK